MEAVAEIIATVTNAPVLRFPEFEGEWEIEKLGSLSARISDGIHTTPKYDDKGSYYFVNGNNLVNGKIQVNDKTKKVNEVEAAKHKRELNYDTLLMSINGTIGNLAFYNNEPVILGKSACYINLNSKAVPKLIYFLLQNGRIQRFYNAEVTGTTIKNLSLATIKSTKLFLPSLPEQQKIASFLSAADDKIQQLSKKKALLEKYKKGVMQRLFKSSELGLGGLKDERISEGENGADPILKSVHPKNPNSDRLRFKDDNGNDFPEWEVKKLGDIAKISKGKGISKSDITEGGALECIRYGELYTHYGEVIQDVISRTSVSVKELVLSEYNDVIIPASGETQMDIAKASCVLKDGVALGGDLNIIKTRQNGVFLSYYMNNKCKKAIASLAQGVSVVHLYASQLNSLSLYLPSIEEQTKIANFLTSIDNKINYTSKQLEQAQQFKKGLLQQLFV